MSAIIVRLLETGEEVHRVDTTGKSERHIDRVEGGMSINLNHEMYYLDVEE